LPMLMRGMTIPSYKGKYIISDAAREGRKYNHEIKSIYSFPSISKSFSSFAETITIGSEETLD